MAPHVVTDCVGLVPTVGLEIHARLLTRTKLFCACRNRYGKIPNSQTCPVCLGLPGTLPALAPEAADLAVRAGLALGCRVASNSVFARKNYFYPDLPRNYQITQYEYPLCTGGEFAVPNSDLVVRLERIHLEEDAGRTLATPEGQAGVDLNRAGTPLIEIVTLPDLSGGEQAAQWLRRLRQLLLYLGVCDGNLAEGSLRCDANVGFGPAAEATSVDRPSMSGPWSEIKNLNSFRAVAQAVEFEIGRLQTRLAEGRPLLRETRSWNDRVGQTEFMRRKESAADYRYFPEPDLPILVISARRWENQKARLPELPLVREDRLIRTLGLRPNEAVTLCNRPELADYFEQTLAELSRILESNRDPSKLAGLTSNWIRTEVLAVTNQAADHTMQLMIPPDTLARLLALLVREIVSGPSAKVVFARLAADPSADPNDLVAELDLVQISDPEPIARWCTAVLDDQPQAVAEYRSGKTELLDFFVGQVLRLSGRRANPRLVRRELRQMIRRFNEE